VQPLEIRAVKRQNDASKGGCPRQYLLIRNSLVCFSVFERGEYIVA
jgi:hypothetical protein